MEVRYPDTGIRYPDIQTLPGHGQATRTRRGHPDKSLRAGRSPWNLSVIWCPDFLSADAERGCVLPLSRKEDCTIDAGYSQLPPRDTRSLDGVRFAQFVQDGIV